MEFHNHENCNFTYFSISLSLFLNDLIVFFLILSDLYKLSFQNGPLEPGVPQQLISQGSMPEFGYEKRPNASCFLRSNLFQDQCLGKGWHEQ
jgi:hypothetical protein